MLLLSRYFRVIALLALSSTGSQSALHAQPPVPTGLVLNRILEREIHGGEIHVYQIAAEAGQFAHVELQQLGVDVRLSIAGPNGEELLASDLPNGANGPESLAIIVSLPGPHQFRVSAPGARDSRGAYQIQLLALRTATTTDIQHAKAEQTFQRAVQLRTANSAEARREAIANFDAALPFFVSNGDSYRRAIIANSTGLLFARLGDMRSALPRYEEAIGLYHLLKDPGEGGALNNAGGAADVLGDFVRAKSFYELALSVFARNGNYREQANTLSNLGKLAADQSNWQKALAYYADALKLNRELGEKRREAIVLGNLGSVYLGLGDYDRARDYIEQALKLEQTITDSSHAVHLVTLGATRLRLNQNTEALPLFEQASAMYRTLGDRRGEGTALSYWGQNQALFGDRAKGIEALEQAIALLSRAGDRRGEAVARRASAEVQTAVGDPRKAIEYATSALEGFRAIGDSNGEAYTLVTLASAQRKAGDLAAARQSAAQAITRTEAVRTGVGTDQTRATYLASRQDAYTFTIGLLMQLGLPSEALAMGERARARGLMEMLAEGNTEIRSGLDPALVARQRQISDALNGQGARLLQQRDETRRAALQQEVRNLEQEYQTVQAALRMANPHYAALAQPEPLTAVQMQALLDADTLLLEYSLGEERSYLWGVTKTGLQAFELPARAKIEAQVDRVMELLTVRGQTKRFETPAERAQRIAHADAGLIAAARELSDMILRPAAAMLVGKRLVIVPDGVLQRLPFSFLPLPGSDEPVVAAHEMVTLPSASALAVLRRELAGRKRAAKTVAVFADPVFDAEDPRMTAATAKPAAMASASRILEHIGEATESGITKIPRLPYTRQEAGRILSVARGGVNLRALDFDANRLTATSAGLGDYRYLHFATHGYLDTERPSLSALVLSQVDAQKQPQDGFLRVSDIYNARLGADLVVLSACQTGLGKEIRGEGTMGLTRAFLYAGVPRVIVSLWNVNDRATAGLMATLYERMMLQGKTPTAALRDAQNALRKQKQWRSPYYWAAFVQHGEWR